MRIAFVYAPVVHMSFEENIKVVDEDFGRLPPLSLLYAAAIAERAGHEAAVFDANVDRLSLEETARRVADFRPDALAFTLSTYMFRQTTDWMAALKERLGVPVIAGGINVRLYPQETATHPAIDYGVRHFGLIGFPLLLDALAQGRAPDGLPEVVFRDRSGSLSMGPIDDKVNPFLGLPRPARHLIQNDKYFSFISQRRNFTVMVTSTGCPFSCAFCAIAALPRHFNPLDRVMEEIADCVQRHGVGEIDFFDGDLLCDRERAVDFCRRLIELNVDMEWSCRTRIDSIDRELLDLAKRAGCRQMYIGIETPDAEAQRRMRKVIRPEMMAERLRWMQDAKIRSLGFFMLGVPGETHRSCMRTIRLAMSLPLDYAQFSRMIPKPGTALNHELADKTGSDYWRDYILGREVPSRVPNIWSSIDERTVEFYTKLAYIFFYYRPTILMRSMKRMRSFDEIWRTARSAFRMVSHLTHTDQR